MGRSTVTVADDVVILGPNAIRGPGTADHGRASVALDCIDDRLALVDDRAVPVEHVWREVMSSAVGTAARIVLVVPSWWPSQRCSLVLDAVPETCSDAVAIRRSDVLRADDTCVVVEIADDLVAVYAGLATPEAIPRTDGTVATSAAVLDRIEGPVAVVIDVPAGVVGARALAEEIGRGLRTRGSSVEMADDGTVLRKVGADGRRRHGRLGRRVGQPRTAVAAASVVTVAGLACAAVGSGAEDAGAARSVAVVEGRVAVEVPADWRVERITTGPGSARLQVVSPLDPELAIHVTQSPVPMQQSIAAAADVLQTALDAQPHGVFGEFHATDRRAGRPAITYREVRPDHVVDWTVVLDGGVRIAIGCQGAPDRDRAGPVCERAIRSARVLG